MREVDANACTTICLGKQGENLATKVKFRLVYVFRDKFGEGHFALIHQRSGDEAPYPIEFYLDGDAVVWEVSNADTAMVGYGKCELIYYVDEVIAKSVTFATKVLSALSEPTEEPPEPWEGWVDSVLEAGEEARAAREEWENMSAEAETLPPGSEATAFYADGVLTIGVPAGSGGTWGSIIGNIEDQSDLSEKLAEKYEKPTNGIPKTDLASSVQNSLGKADSAVQPEAGKGLFSGNYNDLTNKPTNVSTFYNDAGYLTSHQSLSAYRTASAQDVIDAGKADIDDVPTKTSDLINDSGFLTEHQSLTGYATEAWVNSKGYGTYSKPSGGIPKTDLASSVQNSLGKADSAVQPETGKGLFSGDYSDLTNKPTNVSAFNNDAGYLTSHQSLAAYRTASAQDVIDAGKADIDDVPTKTSDLTNDSGFLTEHQSLAAYRTAAAQDVIDAGKADVADLGTKIDNPSTKANEDALVYNGTSWQAQKLDTIKKLNSVPSTKDTSIISVDNSLYAWVWVPPDYLCFTAEEANSTISMEAVGSAPSVSIETSTDGTSWTPFVVGSTTITLANIGDKVYFRGNNTTFGSSNSNYNKFVMTGEIAARGNIMSLLDADNFENNTTISSAYCYAYLFSYCTSLTSAPKLPATTLANNCYYNMFYNCQSLITAPELPATTLANSCYTSMFSSCTSLTATPELPATTLAAGCYENMFVACHSLTIAPALPATTLAVGCYREMFRNCSGIKLSTIQDSTYTTPYRIPILETGVTATVALDSMFAYTGGTFKGTPTINTTYYGAW